MLLFCFCLVWVVLSRISEFLYGSLLPLKRIGETQLFVFCSYFSAGIIDWEFILFWNLFLLPLFCDTKHGRLLVFSPKIFSMFVLHYYFCIWIYNSFPMHLQFSLGDNVFIYHQGTKGLLNFLFRLDLLIYWSLDCWFMKHFFQFCSLSLT